MKILVTGSKGFIGKNLISELRNRKHDCIFEYGRDSDPAVLDEYCRQADFVCQLAGINRPKDPSEYMDGNLGFTAILLNTLKRHQNYCPVMMSSSIQAGLQNPYGISKRASENILLEYSRDTGAKVLIYRLPNVFGKWAKPNYNSVIATFCHNVTRDFPITVNDPSVILSLVYIDDLVEELINALDQKPNLIGDFCEVPIIHTVTLGEIVELVNSFKHDRDQRAVPDMSNAFVKKLYSTYLSYLPEDEFSYELKMNVDQRGSFTEFIRTLDRGQISVNISKPGITKGNHWHHTKTEKFLVVSGQGVIRFRKTESDHVIEYFVSGDKMEVVDIPPGYTHNIENLGDIDMVTIMWANECFDPERPDTHYLEV